MNRLAISILRYSALVNADDKAVGEKQGLSTRVGLAVTANAIVDYGYAIYIYYYDTYIFMLINNTE